MVEIIALLTIETLSGCVLDVFDKKREKLEEKVLKMAAPFYILLDILI